MAYADQPAHFPQAVTNFSTLTIQNRDALFLRRIYTLSGKATLSKLFLSPPEKGSTLKGKNLKTKLPLKMD